MFLDGLIDLNLQMRLLVLDFPSSSTNYDIIKSNDVDFTLIQILCPLLEKPRRILKLEMFSTCLNW
jgi:hypothetical protein